MFRISAILCLCLLIPFLQSCATAPKKKAFRKDPLIGKVIRTRDQTFVTFKQVVDEAAGHDVIYLSEKHDNPMHHAIQHRIIQDLADRGLAPVIGFEFFAASHTPTLLNFMDTGKGKHPKGMQASMENALRKSLNWDMQPDTLWGYYFDLLKLARDNHLTAVGLDLGKSQTRRITRKGASGLTPIEKKLLFSSGYANPAYEAYMKSIFKRVHCGMEHGKMTDRLYEAWLARNDQMALSITRAAVAEKRVVVVIMGNGHTEYGLGVMDRVAALAPQLSQKNIAFTEIFPDPADLGAYLAPLDLDGFDPVPPADFIWFTQRVSYEDPCEKFKAAFKKMGPARIKDD